MSAQGYIAENWILILTLLGFTISLISTVFMDAKTIRRLYALILEVFVLSIIVYIEFKTSGHGEYRGLRTILTAVRYTATPALVAQLIFTIFKEQKWLKWFVYIPSVLLAIFNAISVFTGVVFGLDENNRLIRGPLWLLPYIFVGIYSVYFMYLLIRRGAKQKTEYVPIVFFGFAFASGVILPFIIGSEYSKVFCETIAVSVFVYYVFSILQLTKRDALTGLLNRQAYYADINRDTENITALISIDMNGLKVINDKEGHLAGDTAITTLADCFLMVAKNKHRVYRVGGDEFVIICRRCSEDTVTGLCSRIRDEVAKTRYSCSVGYCYEGTGSKSVDDMLKASDENMYKEKEKYYQKTGSKR